MNIAISCESTVDLTDELLNKFDIKTVPFTVVLGEKEGLDGKITSEEIFDYVDKNKVLPKTSAVNTEQYREHFSELLKSNQAVIHFSLSSEMSSAYNNAVLASKEMENVFVIDSRTLSTGIALLAIYAGKLAEKGLEPKEIVKKCEKRIPFVQASFELKRVDYLYKGGRCGVLSLLGANILKIRPQIIVKDGKMISGSKYRGNMEHVVESYCRDVLDKYDNPDLSTVFLTYSTATPEMIKIAYDILKDRGFEQIYITRSNATISSHCGDSCLGILYINDGAKDI